LLAMSIVRLPVLVCALTVMAPALALAANGIHPRTPVDWTPAPECLTIVDRSVDPKLVFNYAIPYEDLRPNNAVDEVDDSRRHQFVAFCRDHSPQQPLPVWLSDADAAAAEAVGVVKVAELKSEEVFETSPEWKDCFVRITPDDQRRLITFAAAKEPVVWDTTGLAVGAYVVSGYTWEPAFNIWSPRPGIVKVVDDPDPSASPPALAVLKNDDIAYSDETLAIVGCLAAMDGSTVTGYWASTNDDTEDVLEWTAFAVDTPVSGDSFELSFEPPAETIGGSVAIKVEITDPMDRKFTAHMPELATILPGSAGGTGDCGMEGGNFISMPGCGTGDDSEGAPTTGGEPGSTGGSEGAPVTGTGGVVSESGETTPVDGGGAGGCACTSGGHERAPWLGLFAGLWWLRRARRPR
jgi:hypothetical protein